jgi:hypothetical protein
MSLLSIIQGAVREIPELEVPQTVIGNNNQTAVKALAFAQSEGEALAADEGAWQALTLEHSFLTTLAGATAGYALPDDYDRIIDETWWDRTGNRPLIGPVSAREWQAFKSGAATTLLTPAFRVFGGRFWLLPESLEADRAIAYEYVTTDWVLHADASTGVLWTADTDVPRFNEPLMKMGIKWRLLASDGMAYAEDFNAYERRKAKLFGRDKGNRTLHMDGPTEPFYPVNIPDSGVGS